MKERFNLSKQVNENRVNEEDNSPSLKNCIETSNKTSNENEPKRASCLWKTRGGWKVASIILANQGLANVAHIGIEVNLVLFLTRVLGQSNADAVDNFSKWTGTVYLCSLIGAFISDSYCGCYLTCALSQLIFVLGLVLLSISSSIFLIKPSGCGDGKVECEPTSRIGVAIFYISIYLIALGFGGHQPTIATLGADQFDETNPKQKTSKAAFFSYFFFAQNVGSLFSTTIISYYHDSGEWTLGFLAFLGSTVIALASFLIATPGYHRAKPSGNPLLRLAQVFVATMRKWHIKPANASNLYELQGHESTITGCRKILHSHEIRCLDKAATIAEDDRNRQKQNPWRLCTITQVEEAKCVLKMLPVWLCTIMYSVISIQVTSLFVEQGDVMYRKIGNIDFPAATMYAFAIFTVLVFTIIYQQGVVPIARKLSGNPKGLSELQRMGIGLVIGMLSMIAAGVTEIQRRKLVAKGQKISSLSIFWQIPQQVLAGASEVFMYVGQLEFFNEQASDGMKSIGSSLSMASLSLGSYANSLLVIIVMHITSRGKSPGWIPKNLNEGHLERFFFLIAGLTVFDCFIYCFCAKWYKPINNLDEKDSDYQDYEHVDDIGVVERV